MLSFALHSKGKRDTNLTLYNISFVRGKVINCKKAMTWFNRSYKFVQSLETSIQQADAIGNGQSNKFINKSNSFLSSTIQLVPY